MSLPELNRHTPGRQPGAEDDFLLTCADATGDFRGCEILILGCGNVLFGDDGFGPAVARQLQRRRRLPAGVAVVNAGLGARRILFDVALLANPPRQVWIIDAMDAGRRAGTVFELEAGALPAAKTKNFSLHQVPASNLLQELQQARGISVKLLCAQVRNLPEEVQPGLSPEMHQAVTTAVARIERILKSGNCEGESDAK